MVVYYRQGIIVTNLEISVALPSGSSVLYFRDDEEYRPQKFSDVIRFVKFQGIKLHADHKTKYPQPYLPIYLYV